MTKGTSRAAFLSTPQVLLLTGLFVLAQRAPAQMEHMPHGESQVTSMHMHHGGGMMKMTSAILLTAPMERDGSGTSWLPDSVNSVPDSPQN